MPNHKSAVERVRRNKKQQDKNKNHKRQMKEAVKAVTAAKDKKTAQDQLKQTVSVLDKLVVKGIIHKNKAANQKSKLAKKVQALA
ncbi:MAG TPA: 30S ribosomal protein S20 [bacterium]|nr:30S ribosomal protein S20 [bacterium]HND77514.1 30S ribosomal protein S20 [bacterium]HNE83917.1 30S ribosomal protein S20 [bacterium]HNI12221.1 30S ribosomal protein S20 [bacterium]HNJ72741.1 30S ribosomal protein S20 [bacterium]